MMQYLDRLEVFAIHLASWHLEIHIINYDKADIPMTVYLFVCLIFQSLAAAVYKQMKVVDRWSRTT